MESMEGPVQGILRVVGLIKSFKFFCLEYATVRRSIQNRCPSLLCMPDLKHSPFLSFVSQHSSYTLQINFHKMSLGWYGIWKKRQCSLASFLDGRGSEWVKRSDLFLSKASI